MPDVASASVSVVAHTLLKGALLLSGAVDTLLLEFVSDPEPASEPKTSSIIARPSSATAAQPFVAHKWMQKYLDKPKPDPEHSVGSSSASSGPRGDRDTVRLTDMDVDEVEAAFAEVEAQRGEFRQGLDVWGDGFMSNVLGGAWTQGSKSVAGDRVKCWGAHKDARKFA